VRTRTILCLATTLVLLADRPTSASNSPPVPESRPSITIETGPEGGDSTRTRRRFVRATRRAGPETGLELSLYTDVDSNPFRMKDSWLDRFDGMRDPGERFSGFESTSDQIVIGRARGSISWKTTALREIRFEAGVRYRRYLQNDVASHMDLETAVGVSAAKGSRTSLEIDFTPERFRANYLDEQSLEPVFEPARARDLEVRIAHRQRVSDRVSLTGTFGTEWRRYDAAFAERDRRAVAGTLSTRLETSRRSRLEIEAGWEGGTTTLDGAIVDRSYDQVAAGVEFTTRLGAWSPTVSADLRRRRYTTDDETDFSRHGRIDTGWTLDAVLERPAGRHATVFFGAEYGAKSSNRPGDPLDPEIVPYSRYRVRLGLTIDLKGN
jgi:hypothetical protein